MVVSGVILVVSLFFTPQPQNFFILAIFLPVAFYFWVKVIDQEDNSVKWSFKLLSLMLVVSLAGVVAFNLAKRPTENSSQTAICPAPTETVLGLQTPQATPSDLGNTLEDIKATLIQIKAEEQLIREFLNISPEKLQIIDSVLQSPAGLPSPSPKSIQ